jgi:AcrR family transcriptional regulator
MGTLERREREKLETRTKIIDAARELFAREGYEAVSMRRIAEAIEYSPTAIYVHFKDKADLMREICQQDFGKMAERNRVAAQHADPVERIRQLGLGYIQFAVTHPNHFRLMFMTKPTPELTDVSEDQLREQGKGDPNRDGYALLKLCVEVALAQNRFRPDLTDPDLICQILWAAVHGVASLHITRPDHENWCPWRGAAVLGPTVTDTILRGMLRDPSSLTPDL